MLAKIIYQRCNNKTLCYNKHCSFKRHVKMTDFDYQWKNLPSKDIELNEDRIKDFLTFTKLKPDEFIKDKYCLDAGCGSGRFSYAMQKLGARKVDSIDVSSEAIAKCKKEVN